MSHEQVVHIVDDDMAVRQSLAFLLGSAGLSVRLYDSALSFLSALPSLAHGCIVTDIRMPEMDGLELQRHLHNRGIDLPVIVITGHADVPMAVEAMKAGAVDFIEKPFDDEALLSAIRTALDTQVRDAQKGSRNTEIVRRIASLSERERQVLDGLVAGKANKVIAYDLGISPRTVEIYRANVMTKMQAASLSELVRMALMAGHSPV
ncbi:response regulator FixJ [Microvirga massiliensis]|uniref:response regulator FixJ n=1 Tax=Microvirga massiliensis TaxID=1033741 RepID=UPI00062B90D1|nr:response regulator FixJ [Microvirga massiliensis]